MKKILFVNACIRPCSRTRLLAQKVLDRMEGQIDEVNLCRENPAPLNWEQLEKRTALTEAQNYSSPLFQYARQFAEADEILVAAPYWDLAFPSVLRVYFEHTSIIGVTFKYSPEGLPIGLCKAKRIIYVTTAGGTIGGNNLGYDYIKTLAGTFYGIKNVLCFKAENLDSEGVNAVCVLQDTMKEIENSDFSIL